MSFLHTILSYNIKNVKNSSVQQFRINLYYFVTISGHLAWHRMKDICFVEQF